MDGVAVAAFSSKGSGDGSGSGSGSGSGYGSGYGSGNSDGYGSGNSDGSGSGSGYGFGSGYGDYGIKAINGQDINMIDGVQTIVTHLRGNIAKGGIVKGDLTIEPCYIVKQDGVFAHGETLREAQTALLEKLFDDMPEEDRIAAFIAEFPMLDTVVKNQSLFDWHHRLTGSCEQGRRVFAANHGIDMNGSMTVREFINLTKNEYGGQTIQNLHTKYVKE